MYNRGSLFIRKVELLTNWATIGFSGRFSNPRTQHIGNTKRFEHTFSRVYLRPKWLNASATRLGAFESCVLSFAKIRLDNSSSRLCEGRRPALRATRFAIP